MPRYRKPLEQRFWEKVQKTAGCWIWTGGLNFGGYGNIRDVPENGSKKVMAHRLSLQLCNIKIPDGMLVDHMCRNRACVRPSHLRIVTHKQNTLENSLSIQAKNASKTHCNHGHELIAENLVRSFARKRHQRICKVCLRERARKIRAGRSPEQILKHRAYCANYYINRKQKLKDANV